MAFSVNDNGTWKTVKKLSVNDGTWKAVKTGWINKDGVWTKFYSDTATVNVTSQNNINLRTLYTNQTGDSSSDAVSVIFNINGNIGSTSTGTASMVTGTWPAGCDIVVNVVTGVYVVGAGGIPTSSGARIGGAGGNAISLSYNITINNSGTIGGGGGAGGGYYQANPGNIGGAINSYGGGGAGLTAGSSVGGSGGGTLTSGGGGTFSEANACGYGFCSCWYRGYGGAGGSLGQDGVVCSVLWSGGQCNGSYPYATGGSGGAAGKAIALNGYTATRTGNAPLGAVS